MSTHEDELCRIPAELLAQSHENPSLLKRLRVDCPRSGEPMSGEQCARCARFVAWVLPNERRGAQIICRLPCPHCGNHTAASELATPVLCDVCCDDATDAEVDLGGGD